MQLTQDQVVEKIRDYLRRESSKIGMSIRVLDEGVRNEEDRWWYVPVQPSVQPAKLSEYYEMLAEVETLMLDNEGVSVTLVPTLPDET